MPFVIGGEIMVTFYFATYDIIALCHQPYLVTSYDE